KNYRFLKNILDRGLLVRRINIRQVVSYKNTKIEREQRKNRKGKQSQRKHIILEKSKVEKRFIYYRDKIRKEIDHTFLKKNFPIGVVLDEVIIEAQNPGYYLARPLGSYPITIKIPTDDLQATEAKQNGRPCRVVITGFEERSIQALNYPVDLHKLGRKALETLPGLSKKQAVDLFLRLGQNQVSDAEKAALLHQSTL
ncbi:MAG: hypothetical protein H3C43_00740, partial [Leptonema sp. (in: Bacteria)]|nr:hypothetical protein [Leptonema sp. (in: bacteria)]